MVINKVQIFIGFIAVFFILFLGGSNVYAETIQECIDRMPSGSVTNVMYPHLQSCGVAPEEVERTEQGWVHNASPDNADATFAGIFRSTLSRLGYDLPSNIEVSTVNTRTSHPRRITYTTGGSRYESCTGGSDCFNGSRINPQHVQVTVDSVKGCVQAGGSNWYAVWQAFNACWTAQSSTDAP